MADSLFSISGRRAAVLCLLCAISSASAVAGEALSNVTFVAYDLETTSLDASSGRVIEIGAVKFRAGGVIGKKSWLINPGVPIPEASRRIHGITGEMVAGSPSFAVQYAAFTNFAGNAVLLSHNARFDTAFIAAEAARNKMAAPGNRVFDTLQLARKMLPKTEGHSLEALCRYFGISQETAHRALDDAVSLMSVFLRMTSKSGSALNLADLERLAGGPVKWEK